MKNKMMRWMVGSVIVLGAWVHSDELILPLEGVIWSQGFNGNVSWDQGSFGWQFGIQNPGMIQKDPPANTEGRTFCGANTSSKKTDAIQEAFGRMVTLVIPEVEKSGEVYTFTGKISWRYSTPEAAMDLLFYHQRTGFFFAPDDQNAKLGEPFCDIVIGEFPQAEWSTITWSYTTTRSDVGDPIYLWLEVHDKNCVGGLTQLLVDDWKVTKD